jgi:carboxypeptidase PM20D1
MEWYFYLLIAAGAALFALILTVLIRTLRFRPIAQKEYASEAVFFDKDASLAAMQALIRFKTVSNLDPEKEDEAEFAALIAALPSLYPTVYEKATLTTFDGRGLLYHVKGREGGDPTVLMAHYDVVSVQESDWKHPPFCAEIIDGEMWGRGTLDTKVTFHGALFATNTLLSEGFVPKNDLYLAFSGGEEVNGPGARNIVKYFEEKGIKPALVLDEGGAVVENFFPGVKRPCAMVGIAEKGMMNVRYTVSSGGGHASAPKPGSPLVRLSKACLQLEKHPFPLRPNAAAMQMFDTVARESGFLFRMIFANLWLFKGVLNLICRLSGGELNALLRTTVAFTQSEGSAGANVLPPRATLVSNMRLNPLDNIDSALAYLKKTVNDDKVDISLMMGENPSNISRTDVEGYDRVANAIGETWEGTMISPYLMVQCSDSRHWSKVSDRVYRFSAMKLSKEERATIHGNNERIPIETLHKAVEFYLRIIKNS